MHAGRHTGTAREAQHQFGARAARGVGDHLAGIAHRVPRAPQGRVSDRSVAVPRVPEDVDGLDTEKRHRCHRGLRRLGCFGSPDVPVEMGADGRDNAVSHTFI
ncbi:hypothetical protein GCM10027068_44280 [Prescottella soli]